MIDARIQKSRQALITAGLKLINLNKESSFSDIAKEAGVGRATLYRLFNSKEALIEAIAIYCIDAFEEVTNPIDSEASSVLNAFELLFDYAMPLTEELQFLSTFDYYSDEYPEINRLLNKHDQELSELLEYGKKEGSIDKALPTTWIMNFIDGLFYMGWVQQKEHQFSADEVSELAYLSFSRLVSSTQVK